MVRNRAYLTKRVSARIDEVVPEGENKGGQTSIEAPIETIDDELDYSAHYILRTAKIELLFPTIQSDKKHFHGDSVNEVNTRLVIDSNRVATIVCPEDFLRFVACRLSGWKRDLKEIISQTDAKYRFQEGNKYTSGSADKPEGAMVSFGEYLTTITHGGVGGGPFTAGEKVTGGTSGAVGYFVESTSSTVLTLDRVTGHFEAAETITGADSSATATIASGGIVDEYNKWVISQTLAENETLANLYNGQTPASSGATALSTDDIIILTGQSDEDENGTYKVNASGAPTKLTDSTSTGNSGTAIQCFRAASTSDTLTKFHYVPRLTAEEMPEDLIDPLIWHCAGRVLEYMGRMEESTAAIQKADALLGNLKLGLQGEGGS